MGRIRLLADARWGAAAIAAALSLASCASSAQPAETTPALTATGAAATPAVASAIVVATGLDTAGNPVGIATVFDRATQRKVLILVPSQGAAVGTSFAYTRYLAGKYIDTHSARLLKPSLYFFFETVAKPGQQLVAGHFRYQLYVDRSFLGAVEFDVR